MGVSHIYDSVCYSSASLQSLSVTLTQLHSVRGEREQSRNREVERMGKKQREKMSPRYTDKNKNIMSEPEKRAEEEDMEEERYGEISVTKSMKLAQQVVTHLHDGLCTEATDYTQYTNIIVTLSMFELVVTYI